VSRLTLGLLIGEVGIVDRGDPVCVAVPQHSPQFMAGHLDPARDNQGSVAEIDEPDLSSRFDALVQLADWFGPGETLWR
jgi:hypothetical protein